VAEQVPKPTDPIDVFDPACPLLVVDGQGLEVSRSGGTGTYARQLEQRLRRPSTAELLSGCRLELVNFPASPSVATPRRSLRGRLGRLARRILPDTAVQGLRSWADGGGQSTPTTPAAWSLHPGPIILHELSNYAVCPAAGRLALSPRMKLLVTFHDIQDFDLPQFFDDVSLLRRRMLYTFYADRGDLFFANSEFTKETIVDRLGIAPERVVVTHLAADDPQLPETSAAAQAWVRSLGRYMVFPAKAWPHKNHEFLLRSLGRRRESLARAGMQLLLTGGFDAEDRRRLGELVAAHGLSGCVKLLGFQPAATLQALIRSAEYMVFPSLYEGFGLPILEAMTLGCPVLSSNATSLPEVGGDAAEYFDPREEESLVDVLDRALAGSIDRDALIRRGQANCRRFSWERTCRLTIEEYRRLL